MQVDDFRERIWSQRLERFGSRRALRLLLSGSDSALNRIERKKQILERSLQLADRHLNAARKKRSATFVAALSAELFLLHIGADSPWSAYLRFWLGPTSRVDPAKYQRNVLHQLRNLPAAQLLTLPGLARNLGVRDLPYRVTEPPDEETRNAWDRMFEGETASRAHQEQLIISQVTGNTPEDALFLQFSGGTTGNQKCVVVTAGVLTTQIRSAGLDKLMPGVRVG